MRAAIRYIQAHKLAAILFFLCVGITALVFFLSDLPVDTVLYAALLCLLTAGIVLAFDLRRFWRLHRDLTAMENTIDVAAEHLPEPRNCLEEDYTRLVQELYRQKKAGETQSYMAAQERGDYFTLWAHQIKTPIAAMSLILQNKGPNVTAEDRELEAELFNIEEYVNTLMSYVRIQDISADLVFEPVDMRSLIHEAAKKYARLFIRRKISLEIREMDWQVISDRKWLFFVLGQILSNSLKYTGKGGTVTIWRQGESLHIADNGIGIRAEDLPRLFEQGFTGENGRMYNKSTGQGLYLCKTVMDRLEHTIRVEAVEGRGTTVVLGLARDSSWLPPAPAAEEQCPV